MHIDTRAQFDLAFPDESAAAAFLARLRWPDGEECRFCASKNVVWLATRPVLHCRTCRRQTSLRSGTALQGTNKPLRDWVYALWRSARDHSISAAQLHRELGYGSYVTAWSMLHKVRAALSDSGAVLLAGPDVILGYARLKAPVAARDCPPAPHGVVVAVAVETWRPGVLDPQTRVAVATPDVRWPDSVHSVAVEKLAELSASVTEPAECRLDMEHSVLTGYSTIREARWMLTSRCQGLAFWLRARFRGVSARYLPNYASQWLWAGGAGPRESLVELATRLLQEPHRPGSDLATAAELRAVG